MEHDLYGGQKDIWNMLRNIIEKKHINEHLSFTNISILEWEDYFENVYRYVEDSYDDRSSNYEYTRMASAANYTISSERV